MEAHRERPDNRSYEESLKKAIDMSTIKLQEIENERADNRKRYEEELMKALKLSMEKE